MLRIFDCLIVFLLKNCEGYAILAIINLHPSSVDKKEFRSIVFAKRKVTCILISEY
jgi:hypothetical protein